MIIWTGIITLIIGPMAWAFRYLVLEVKAQQLLLRETREDYVKKQDLKSEMEDLHKKILVLELQQIMRVDKQ